MTFLQPWAWGFLLLAMGVTALYFLRRREDQFRVSALWLWQQETERPRSALSFLWTNIGLLILQLAALIGLTFALTMPFFSQELSRSGRLAILIDSSASMQALEGSVTRYDRARSLAIEQIERLQPREIAILQAQHEPRFLVPLIEDRAAAIRALQRSQPSLQADASWGTLMQLLISLGEISQFTEIFYISDRPPEEEERVHWLQVGSSVPNLALTDFAVRPLPGAPTRLALWGRVENSSDVSLAGHFRILAEEREIYRQEIRVGARKSQEFETLYQSTTARHFIAQLEVDDAFAPDNQRYFLLPTPKTLRILWLGERNFFLERALALYAEPHFEFFSALATEPYVVKSESYDLVVANNINLPSIGSGRWFLINSALEPLIKIVGDRDVNDPVRWVQAAHPVLEHVQMAHLQPLRVRDVQLAPSVHSLADVHQLPLIALHSSAALRLIYFGTSLQESALVLTPSFPVFIQNIVRWLLLGAVLSLEEQYVNSFHSEPGFHDDRAINIDPSEAHINSTIGSASPRQPLALTPTSANEILRVQTPIWWYGACAALLFLFLEIVLYIYRPSFHLRSLWHRVRRGER